MYLGSTRENRLVDLHDLTNHTMCKGGVRGDLDNRDMFPDHLLHELLFRNARGVFVVVQVTVETVLASGCPLCDNRGEVRRCKDHVVS